MMQDFIIGFLSCFDLSGNLLKMHHADRLAEALEPVRKCRPRNLFPVDNPKVISLDLERLKRRPQNSHY